MLGAQVTHYLSTSVLPLLKVMHHIYACFHGITYTPYTFTNWCNTHHTQKSKHTSYFKVCHGSGRPPIFSLMYLCYPLYNDTIYVCQLHA